MCIRDRSKTNTVDVVDGVNASMEQMMENDLPKDIKVDVVRDQSAYIRENVADVWNAIDVYKRQIIDSHDGLVYVTDMETNEVIFVNKKLLQVIGKNKAEVFGKPCYQALQDKECPCEFCTNSILSENKYYDWEIFREDMQRYFVLHDKLLILGDRKFRVEVGTDITDQVLEKREIKNKLNMEKTLIKCIDTLNHENDVNKAINELLKICLLYTS